jgi:hypothetical protein
MAAEPVEVNPKFQSSTTAFGMPVLNRKMADASGFSGSWVPPIASTSEVTTTPAVYLTEPRILATLQP